MDVRPGSGYGLPINTIHPSILPPSPIVSTMSPFSTVFCALPFVSSLSLSCQHEASRGTAESWVHCDVSSPAVVHLWKVPVCINDVISVPRLRIRLPSWSKINVIEMKVGEEKKGVWFSVTSFLNVHTPPIHYLSTCCMFNVFIQHLY